MDLVEVFDTNTSGYILKKLFCIKLRRFIFSLRDYNNKIIKTPFILYHHFWRLLICVFLWQTKTRKAHSRFNGIRVCADCSWAATTFWCCCCCCCCCCWALSCLGFCTLVLDLANSRRSVWGKSGSKRTPVSSCLAASASTLDAKVTNPTGYLQ